MFAVTKQKAMLKNINVRAEQHGNDTQLAVDLKMSIKVSNRQLDQFDPKLLSALYREADADQADLGLEPGHMPSLVFPYLSPIRWDQECAGYRVTRHAALEKNDVNLIGCKIDGFVFDCQEGGTVIISFRVIAHPAESELADLCQFIQQEIELTLTPPSPEELAQMELDAAA